MFGKIVTNYYLNNMQAKPQLSAPMPSEARRAAMVETVIKLAAEQNPTDVTTAAIATRMGVTQGTLFRHFTNKDAILQAVMAWVCERLLIGKVQGLVLPARQPTQAVGARS